jgi:hypothetical protein
MGDIEAPAEPHTPDGELGFTRARLVVRPVGQGQQLLEIPQHGKAPKGKWDVTRKSIK